MNTVRGLAADEAWQSMLSSTTSARALVHSSFEHALNLEIAGTLMTLMPAGVGGVPGGLLLDAATLPRVPAATPGLVAEGIIRIGSGPDGLAVDARGCEWYSTLVHPVRPVTPLLGRRARLAGRVLDGVARRGSFRASPAPDPVERAVRRRLRQHAGAFQGALAARIGDDPRWLRDDQALVRSVASLVGLGFGLTPSGDDYLVGSLAILHHLDAGRPAARAVGHAVERYLDQTSAVSATYLRAAAQGRFQQSLARACRAALAEDASALASSFGEVAGVGATSGTDALHGLAETLTTLAAAARHPHDHHNLQGSPR